MTGRFISFNCFCVLPIAFLQKSKDQDLGLFSVCGFSLVHLRNLFLRLSVLNYMLTLYKSGRMKEDSSFACECVKELTLYMSGISTLAEQLHIPYTDVCPKTSPYQVQTTVFISGRLAVWLQSQHPNAINSAVYQC